MVRGTRAIDLDWGQGTRAPGGAGRGARSAGARATCTRTHGRAVSSCVARGPRTGGGKENCATHKNMGLAYVDIANGRRYLANMVFMMRTTDHRKGSPWITAAQWTN